MKFYDAAMATWQPVTFNPQVYVVWVERRVRDWRWLWLRKTVRGEIVSVHYDPPVKVTLSKDSYT